MSQQIRLRLYNYHFRLLRGTTVKVDCPSPPTAGKMYPNFYKPPSTRKDTRVTPMPHSNASLQCLALVWCFLIVGDWQSLVRREHCTAG